jgi:iron complex outermembrane receptor protein
LAKQESNRLKLQWAVGTEFSFMGINDYIQKDRLSKNGQWNYNSYSETGLDNKYVGKKRTISSGFIHLRKDFDDRFYLHLGTRADYYSDFGLQLTPRAGLVFKATENSSIKALYSRAFRAPSVEEFGGHWNRLYNENLKPEIIDVAELSWLLRKDNFQFDINGFYSYWNDGIIVKNMGNHQTMAVNLQKNRAFGGEFLTKFLIKSFKADLGFAYSNSYQVSDTGSNIHYSLYPTYALKGDFRYNFSDIKMEIGTNTIFYGDWTATDPINNFFHGEISELKPYWRMDFTLRKELSKHISIDAIVKNIFNKNLVKPSGLTALEKLDGTTEYKGTIMMLSLNVGI